MRRTTTVLGDYFASRRERGDDSLPLLSVTLRDGLVRRDTIERRFESELEDHEHLAVRKGDIAYNMMRMWQGASGIARYDAAVSPAYVVLRPSQEIDPTYASYWFKSARMIYLFWAYSYGLTEDRLRLYYKDFAQIPAEPPPLVQQRRIAIALSECDKAITATEALVSAKRRAKRALMRRLLDVDTVVALGKVARINSRSLGERTPPTYRFEYFPISDEQGEADAAGWMSFAEAPSRARRLAKPGDVAYSTVRPMLRRVFRVPDHPSAVYSTGYAIIEGGPSLDTDFLLHVMTAEAVERQVFARLTGTGYPAISASDLAEISIPLPTLPKQRSIAGLLDTADEEIGALTALAGGFRRQKRALMQRLLPNEWRGAADSVRAAE